jgi:restriction endonuclease S subunit
VHGSGVVQDPGADRSQQHVIPLSDIATIRIGHSFREGVKPDPEGVLAVLQSKDVAEGARIAAADLVRTSLQRFDQSLLAIAGDVALLPRGYRFPAIAVSGEAVGALVAAPLYVIRPNRDRVDADYLAALINTPQVQANLMAGATGSHIAQVQAEVIRDLSLPLPPLPEQRAIAALAMLSREEARLTAAIAAKRSAWLHAVAVHREGVASERNSRGHGNAPG